MNPVGERGAAEAVDYDDVVVRRFVAGAVVWGVLAVGVGVFAAMQLAFPGLAGLSRATFGRLRPVHTNLAVFGFAGNAVFAGIYYTTQRLCAVRMFSDSLSFLHLWGWQIVVALTTVTVTLGMTRGVEFAEAEWPIALLTAVVWIGFFGANFFGTLRLRRGARMYVSLWFFIAAIVVFAAASIGGNLLVPVGVYDFLTTGRVPSFQMLAKSYPLFAGVQDAFLQAWHRHNLIASLLLFPLIGLVYYFIPRITQRPLYSDRLAAVHFWSLLVLTVAAAPRLLHDTAMPGWSGTLGVAFSVMLWMPAWAGIINWVRTLRGGWAAVRGDVALRFLVTGGVFYAVTIIGEMVLSFKEAAAPAAYTDWMIGAAHVFAMGWGAFVLFGVIYWVWPRVCRAELWSPRLAAWHFWLGVTGVVMYAASIGAAGATQVGMLGALTDAGRLVHADFAEVVRASAPMYHARVLGGVLYGVGAVMFVLNLAMTRRLRHAAHVAHTAHAAPHAPSGLAPPPDSATSPAGSGGGARLEGARHRRLECRPRRFGACVVAAVVAIAAVEFVPLILLPVGPRIAGVQPYTALELAGRELYLREGCVGCHSQMIRPLWAETLRYGDYSRPGEFVFDRPVLWGTRRLGPDLAREGGRRSSMYHVLHLQDPRRFSPRSIMPAYPRLLERGLDFDSIRALVNTTGGLGATYPDDVRRDAGAATRVQAAHIAEQLARQGGPEGLEDKEVVALIAYLQRLGTDLNKPDPASLPKEADR